MIEGETNQYIYCRVKQLAVAAQIGEFDFNDPNGWFLRVQAAHQVLQASTGHECSKKIYFLATCGTTAATLERDLIAPQLLSSADVTYNHIKNALLAHLKAQKLEMVERAIF